MIIDDKIKKFNNILTNNIRESLDNGVPSSMIITYLEKHIELIRSMDPEKGNYGDNYIDPSWYFDAEEIKR